MTAPLVSLTAPATAGASLPRPAAADRAVARPIAPSAPMMAAITADRIPLARIPLLAQCSPTERRVIERHVTMVEAPAGAKLAQLGQPADAFLILVSGVAAASGPAGPRFLRAGDQIGAVELLADVANRETVSARTHCEVAVLTRRMFHVLVRDVPPFARSLLTDLALSAAGVTPA